MKGFGSGAGLYVLGIGVAIVLASCGTVESEAPIRVDEEDVGQPEVDTGEPSVSCEAVGSEGGELRWHDCGAAPVAVDHHASELRITDGRAELVFSGGGRDSFSEFYEEIWRLALDEEGAPRGEWEEIGQLPRAMGGHTMNFHGDFVYITGGSAGQGWLTETAYAEVSEEGRVGDFEITTPLPVGVWHHQSFVRDEHLYVVGGQSAPNTGHDGVYRAPILEQGGLGEWETLESLPHVISHHGQVVLEDQIVVVGGLEDADYLEAVYTAKFAADGTLEPWQEAIALDGPQVTPSVVARGDTVYALGGLNGQNVFHGEVIKASVDASGELSGWEPTGSPLPVGRAHVHQVPTFAGRFYTLGGRTNAIANMSYQSTDAFHMGVLE